MSDRPAAPLSPDYEHPFGSITLQRKRGKVMGMARVSDELVQEAVPPRSRRLAATRRNQPGGLSDYSDVPLYKTPLGTYVSLYAGAGGMDIGFALAGFRPVWVNELDPYASATSEMAFKRLMDERAHLSDGGWVVKTGDLLDVPEEELPARGAADIVIGGPPCQGFSVAGKMDPDDQRSRHVFHFMDVVERVAPRAFVMENVKALYENRRWSAVREQLATRAEELGYRTILVLCNASRYGVPQARERMLLIGSKHSDPVSPRPTSSDDPPTLRRALAQLPRVGEPGNDSLCRAKVTPAKAPVMRRSPFAGMMFNGAGRPMELDSPAPTLPASMGGNKTPIVDQEQIDADAEPWILGYHARLWRGGTPFKTVPKRMRRITVEEAAAIQTFPLGMEWCGPQSAQYRQIGNAVPPRMALAAAEAVKETLGLG
jgi:DNA (cytosine-5)-methyltransferase 1